MVNHIYVGKKDATACEEYGGSYSYEVSSLQWIRPRRGPTSKTSASRAADLDNEPGGAA